MNTPALSKLFIALSVGAFVLAILGGIYWRVIASPANPTAADITAAWRDSLSTYGVFSSLALFLGVLAIYARTGQHRRNG